MRIFLASTAVVFVFLCVVVLQAGEISATAIAKMVFESKKLESSRLDTSNLEQIRPALLVFVREFGGSKTHMVKKADYVKNAVPKEILELGPDFITYDKEQIVMVYISAGASVSIWYAVSNSRIETELGSQKVQNKNGKAVTERVSDGIWIVAQEI